MKSLKIPPTENTPSVTLDAEQQVFLIEGESFPESAHKFYQPIIEWLQRYEKVLQTQKQFFEKNRRMTFQFNLDYFNSTSAKYIHEIFSVLGSMTKSGLQVRVKWFYHNADIDAQETGKELAKMVPHLPVKLVEIEEPSKDLKNIYEAYKNLQDDNLCFVYQGDFTDEMTDKILALSEININHKEEFKKIKKKISFLMAESFQNIIRHGNRPAHLNRSFNHPGMFMTENSFPFYLIVSANVVENKNIESIKSKLDRINNLTEEERKALQMEILSTGGLSDSGGAGLGFIDMARKSGQKLEYSFEEVNDKCSFFYLGIKLSSPETWAAGGKTLSLNLAKDFHREIKGKNILMLYKGDFSRDSVLPLLKVIEDNMEKQFEEYKIKKKLFIVLIEILQNISKHAAAVNNVKDGIFMIGKRGHEYVISVGNLLEYSKKEWLGRRLALLNAMNETELNDYYQKGIMKEDNTEQEGAGLGLIEIARSSADKLDYDFFTHKNTEVFFALTVRI